MNEPTYPYIITISSEKGGVGKTTLATNLAIFLKAMHEDLQVSILSLDNHFTIDKMFAIPGQKHQGSVADLLMEMPGSELLHTGQYGVSYIPSSSDLADIRHSINGPMVLSRLLAKSNISGILIIDTRPDLDILTQNALYAADRVIIPVKDMASMDNCRNIFALFDKRGMDRSSLYLIPCLVDERIKYDGPFKDQKSLIKAFTINRGYRSFETIISKSPKVESLNTNPDGKVYPILTHAKGTEVHGQFFKLSNQILRDIQSTSERRAQLFHAWLTTEDQRKKEAFFNRMSGVQSGCLCCGSPVASVGKDSLSFYCETFDETVKGFIDEACFLNLLSSKVYHLPPSLAADDPAVQLLIDAAKESVFVFTMHPEENTFEFHRFDQNGNNLAAKTFSLSGTGSDSFFTAFTHGAFPHETASLQSGSLIVYPVAAADPARILRDEAYRSLSRLKKRIAEKLGDRIRQPLQPAA